MNLLGLEEPLISGKEPSDIAPIVAKTLDANNKNVYDQLVDPRIDCINLAI